MAPVYLLFRWFVGLNMDDAIWDVTVFTKNRQRLLAGKHCRSFLRSCAQSGTPAESAFG
jgi:transposase